MSSADDVRRIALSLPGAPQVEGELRFRVDDKNFAWVWRQRVAGRRGRVPQPEVFAVRVADEEEKQVLMAADPEKFFTEPHYNGYPAVLIRLAAIENDELAELITDAWRIRASRRLQAEFDAGQSQRSNDR
jgi:hypothetical protein